MARDPFPGRLEQMLEETERDTDRAQLAILRALDRRQGSDQTYRVDHLATGSAGLEPPLNLTTHETLATLMPA